MCGISGIISSEESDHQLLESMTDIMKHRGPDSRGFYRDKFVSLGHRRLAIIDLSEEASQPMSNEDGSIYLVCNGEIYNYKEKTAELKARGHVFKSKSDTEVLIHLYEEYDKDLLNQVNGMFAFAIWDSRKRRMLLAVDRFGKKPLYYADSLGRFIFASELKSLLYFDWLKRDLDFSAIDRYLSLRYIPSPLTIFKEIKKLEQATLMSWENGAVVTRRYWAAKPQELGLNGTGCVNRFTQVLTDAVRLRLGSDVPLGVYLSAGIDSAAIAGLMNPLMNGKKISYTVSFDYKYNEYSRAKKIADFLKFEYNSLTVTESDFDLLPLVARYMDEPFGDLLCLPAFLLGKKAKEKLTVVLTGDGADEILNGYLHQKLMFLRQKYNAFLNIPGVNIALSSVFKFTPISLLNSFFDYPDWIGHRERAKLSQSLAVCRNFGAFYEGITSCFSPVDKINICTEYFLKGLRMETLAEEYQREIQKGEGFSFLSRLSLLDLKYWIPFSVIYRLDKMNMAHAVEVRSPFLDYRVVETALNLPDECKISKNTNKVVLRSLIERLYPPSHREKGKQAFYMPMLSRYKVRYDKWVSGLLTLETVTKRGLFHWQYIVNLFKLSEQGSMLANRQLTCLAMLELWFQTFVDR